ncbi:MAG TPA: chorismate mutase [Kofleriaceae bacterium]|nr:chorismate mutase [Kofleriaceae bacterium]
MTDALPAGSLALDQDGTARGRAGTLWIVAGPSHPGSEDHLLATARSIQGHVSAFSAGLWGSAGVGAAGLPWLRRVREEVGLRTAVEVARPDHVEGCLRHGVDILGIDPRAITDARSLDELACALRGVDIPVLVKNPLDPDVRGWIGAFERLAQAGVRVLIGVHQGFSTSSHSPYRYPPNWTVVTELRRRMPHVPVICDPSNIAGASHLVPEVARHAVDMHATGLLIATSDGPDAAAAGQEITPDQLQRLLASLVGPDGGGQPSEAAMRHAVALIDELRQQIDVVDSTLLHALARRMALVEQIGRHKKAASITAVQLDRWMKLVEQRLQLGRSLRLTEGFVLALFELIHGESITVQNDLMQSPLEKVS